MPQSSIFGFYLNTPVTSFDEGEPVSSYRATELQQNLLHLTDEFAQTYINWIAPGGDAIYDASPPGGTQPDFVVWSQTYMHRWLAPGKPSNLDLHVWGDGLAARCRVVPMNAPMLQGRDAGGGIPSVFDVFLNLSAGPVAASYTHQNTADSVKVFDKGWYKPATVAAPGFDGVYEPQVCMMRLEIICLTESPMQIDGVCLRGFA